MQKGKEERTSKSKSKDKDKDITMQNQGRAVMDWSLDVYAASLSLLPFVCHTAFFNQQTSKPFLFHAHAECKRASETH